MAESSAPWHAAFPTPKSQPGSINKEQLLQWLQEGKEGGIDFVLVDLRRNDYEGGTIRGSINLPAQSLYPTMPYLFNIFSAAGVKKIMWYCGKYSVTLWRTVKSQGSNGNRLLPRPRLPRSSMVPRLY